MFFYTQASTLKPVQAHNKTNFLPDFCNVNAVFGLVIVAELIALALSITRMGVQTFNWLDFGITSIFIQWVVLMSAALICLLRPLFDKTGAFFAGACSYVIVLLLTFALSIFAELVLPQQSFFDWTRVGGNVIVASVFAGILLRYFYVQQQLRNQQQAELNSRVQALQSRIRPHFLFNSMNAIASLIDIDPQKAEQTVLNLSKIFRASLQESRFISLQEELELCRQFADIEQTRLGSRLTIRWHTDDVDLAFPIPSLILQPLLENAIYHGIQPLAAGGVISITVQTASTLTISIENPVSVNSPAMQELNADDANRGNGMAQANIRNRLAALYGNKGKFQIDQLDDKYVVRLEVPRHEATQHKKGE